MRMLQIFKHATYSLTAILVALSVGAALLLLDGYLFYQPYLVLYVPAENQVNFALILAIAALAGFAVTLNIHLFRSQTLSVSRRETSGVAGSMVGLVSGVCGCSTVGFNLISLLGSAGGIMTALVYRFQIPLKLVSIFLLTYSIYSIVTQLTYQYSIPPGMEAEVRR